MRIALFCLALLIASPALAETAEDARKELSATGAAIKEADARRKELERKSEQLQTELKNLEEEMALMGKRNLKEEEALSSHEDKLAILEGQKKEKKEALAARQTELSQTISAMIKLKSLPPEAVIAMPGKLDETLATARALSIVTKTIEEEAESLKGQLHELDLLEEKIRHGRATVASHKATLASEQTALAAKIKERTTLVEKLGGEATEEKERVAHLTERSKSLQELVDSLARSEYGWEHEREGNGPPKRRAHASQKSHSFEHARGHITLPASGKIVSHFGNPEASASFAKGIVIETRAEASVVAPFDGEVVFAGPFRDYGRMVIIRHSGDYHTLLSGMDEIDCEPGQHVLEGEPVGSMSTTGAGRLYMELREDGRPVDPSEWVKG